MSQSSPPLASFYFSFVLLPGTRGEGALTLSLFPPDRTVQSGAHTHWALTHQQKIIRIFPHFSALNQCYPRLICYATGASATIHMLPMLNKQHYRRLCINLYATSTNHFRCVAQPQQCICTKRTLPTLNPLRYGCFCNNATSVYASICELPAPTISDASHSHNDASTLSIIHRHPGT